MSHVHVHRENLELGPERPFWRLVEACQGPRLALLDSALTDGRLGRWSLLLPDPDLVVEARADDETRGIHLLHRDPDRKWREEFRPGDPLAELAKLLARRRAALPPDDGSAPEAPFRSGAMGWFGYGAGRFVDRQPAGGLDVDALPDIHLMFGDVVLAHEHDLAHTVLSVTGRGATPAEARDHALREAEIWRRRILDHRPSPLPRSPTDPATVTPRADLDETAYAARVEVVRQAILAGRVFEVNLTQTLEADLEADPWTLYRFLRETNPAPFAAFLRTPEATVVSSSPERYLHLDRHGRAESRPIKGTRPRGVDLEADDRLHRELAGSMKDRAENVMIVDLVRSDLGRVCETGSVTVPELCAVEGYATVWQMVSTVTGRLRPECGALDLLRACHPPGSMTGAPKIESMQVIDEQETCRRGVYAGGIGYLDDRGGMDLHVVIRTAVVQGRRCRFGVGGAVTADSDPHAEYRETMDKARALVRAVGLANATSRRNR